jgi:hypothetical protein
LEEKSQTATTAVQPLRQVRVGEYVLEPFRPLAKDERARLLVAPPRETRWVIETAFASPIMRRQLVLLWQAERGIAGRDGIRDVDHARSWLLAALESSRPTWMLLRRQLPRIAGELHFAIPSIPPPPERPVAPLQWMELEVLYTDDSGALGLPYRVDVPGDVRTGKLDRYGYAYLTGIKPGSYKTYFGATQDAGPEEQLGWLELELVDAWGIPVAGAVYEITTPDQKTVRGTLDQNGRAHLAGLPEGDCKVIFPELDSSFVKSSE